MLSTVYQSDPYPYFTLGEGIAQGVYPGIATGGFPQPANPNLNLLENFGSFNGMVVVPDTTRPSQNSVYVALNDHVSWWAGFAGLICHWNLDTGAVVKRYLGGFGIVQPSHRLIQSTGGQLMMASGFGGRYLEQMSITEQFGILPPEGAVMYDNNNYPCSNAFLGACMVDDINGYLIDSSAQSIYVWKIAGGAGIHSKGVLQYVINFGSEVPVHIVPEGASRAFVLLSNRMLILWDYLNHQILGAAKVPSLLLGGSPFNNTNVVVAWDTLRRRVLFMEATPNNSDGSSSMYVRGFQSAPVATRLSRPVPLDVPRRGSVTRVVTQLVGDSGEGVSGAVIQTSISGTGSLAAGIPTTDNQGRAIANVSCDSLGDVLVTVSATIEG